MPDIFKALATITAWTLFILSAIGLIRGYVTMLAGYAGVDIMPAGASPTEFVLGFGFIGLVLSIVVMVLRKKME
jgi:hydrogenase/urease accessory protein HupE